MNLNLAISAPAMNLKCLFHSSLLLLALPSSAGTSPDTLNDFLRDGRIKEGLAAYATPSDNADAFSLAVLQALAGLQEFSSGMHTIGIKSDFTGIGIPFFRVVPSGSLQDANEPATPARVANLFRDLQSALRRANATLGRMDDREFGVEVNLSQIRADFDGDGECSPEETLVGSLGPVLGLAARSQDESDIMVRFDSADAIWLKGYTHFLAGMLDLFQAYDWRPVWNQCAHVVFLNPEPVPPLASFIRAEPQVGQWVDLIAAVHDMRLTLIDKDGPRRARDEFRAMIACSRVCWQRVLAETDDQNEWLPSPNQSGPSGITITQAQVDAWQRVLDELDAVASGKKLLPHWRLKHGMGINVDKLVAAPPPLDLVLLVQGSALVPYIEEGSVSDTQTWSRLTQVFGPGFARFAIWSN